MSKALCPSSSLLLLGLGGLVLGGCAVNKQCYADGACRVVENGEVRWEGPPDAVAAHTQQAAALQAESSDRAAAFASAEKRPASEPIRVLVVVRGGGGLRELTGDYAAILGQELQRHPRLEVVTLKATGILGKPEDGQSKITTEYLTRLRDFGVKTDTVLWVNLSEKEKSGVVSGKSGVGVVKANVVQMSAQLSSIYEEEIFEDAVTGKSTRGISVAGIDREGKTSQGSLDTTRAVEHDREALQKLASWTEQTLETSIGPKLPSFAEIERIKTERGTGMDALRKMLQGRN